MSDRVILVTGGSRGIGLSCARRFQAAGDHVAVTFRSTPPELDHSSGESLFAIRCDVTDPDQVEAAFEKVESEVGPVEVLICSAGIAEDSLLMRMDEEKWTRVIDTNLTACYRVAKRAISPMIRARRGRIILISSVVGLSGNAGQTNYAAAKAGLIGFGRSFAREVASRGITVNIVAPGFVTTDMTAGLSDKQMEAIVAQIPAGRVASPKEIAGAVTFLASEDAAYVTGAVIPVDGGLGMGH